MAFAETTRGTIYYESHGDGPPLVLAPAFGATSRSYRGMLPKLTDTHRVVLYDLLGMGRSDAMPPGAVMATMGDTLAELLDELAINRASVMGISMGGIIAQQFAVGHRDRLDRLVLIASPATGSEYRNRVNDLLVDLLKSARPERALGHLLNLSLSPSFVDKHGFLVGQMIKGIDVSERDRATLLRLLEDTPNFNGMPGLADMGAPTLIIAGELDILAPPAQARILHEILPNSELLVLEGVAHNPFIEAVGVAFPAVREFLTADPTSTCPCRQPDDTGAMSQ